jgi:gas vesicle protein
MLTPYTNWLFRQLGYAPARTIARDTIGTIGLFAAGLVAGGVAVALFTPKTGRELRSDISNRAGDLKQRVAAKGRQLKENVDDMRMRARDELASATDTNI